jgi:hypothetical protein
LLCARHVCVAHWDGPRMPSGAEGAARGEEGTASVELVAVVPFLLLAVVAVAQIALAGQAHWSAGEAARAGARAAVVGKDPAAAARAALPSAMREDAEVDEEGGIEVQVEVPRLIPALPAIPVEAASALGSADG